MTGSGKGARGEWIDFTDAHVDFDHPQHALLAHGLLVDFLNPAEGPSARVAIELDAHSARRLVRAINEALEAVDEKLLQ